MPSAPAAVTPSTDRGSSRTDALYFPLPALLAGQVLFRTTGAAEIHVGPSVVLTPSSERLFTIMVLCAMSPDHMMARSQLLELVWPDMDVKSARHTLRQQLYRLRQLGVPLTSNRAAVVLDASCLVPSFSLGRTAELFDRDVLQGQEPFGQLFAGWRPEHEVLQQWVEQQRDRYHMDVRRVLLPELHRLRDRADWTECERWARTVLEFDPLNEDATLVLAEAIAMQGSRVDARYVLDGYARETGVAGTELAHHVEEARRRIGRATRVRFEHSATPTLIGRDAELQRLDALTLSALQGETRVVHILGPAGIGKTELAYEATRRAVILGFTRCIVRVTRPMGEVPYGTLSRVVRDLLKLPGALGCRPDSLELLKQLTGESPHLTEVHAPRARAGSLAECLLELLSAIADEQPTVLLVDDLQHVDVDSRAQLAQLEAIAHKTNLLVLLTERTVGCADAYSTHDTVRRKHVMLQPLSLPAAQQLAEAVSTATGRRLRSHAAENVARTSDRTPLHIITLARTRLTEGITAPYAVKLQEALIKQLRALSDAAGAILKCLALLGGKASVLDLDQALELPLAERITAIGHLLDADLMHEDPDGSVRMHDEVRTSVLATMPRTEQTIGARRIALVLLAQLEAHFDPERCDVALNLAQQSGDSSIFCVGALRFCDLLASSGRTAESLKHLRTAVLQADSDVTKRQLLSLQLRVAQRAAAWQQAAVASTDLEQLHESDQIRDFETTLAKLEATIRSEPVKEGRDRARSALRTAVGADTSPQLRLRASRLAVGAASDLFDEPLAITAFSVLDGIPRSDLSLKAELLETTMQFHAIFGDLPTAVSIALGFDPMVRQGLQSAEDARIVCNASYVFRLASETRIAAEWLQAVFTTSAAIAAPGRRAFAAWQLSSLAADRDDAVAAVHWNTAFRRMVTEELMGERDNAFQLHQYKIELLTTDDIADPSAALALVRAERTRPSRSTLFALGLCLCSKTVLRNNSLRDELLAEAQDRARQFGRFAGQDFLILGIVSALQHEGESTRAAVTLKEYFGVQRRERGSPPFFLRKLDRHLQATVTESIAARD